VAEQPARVLFVSGEYPPDIGGVGDYTARLRGALSARGIASAVLTRRDVRRWNARSIGRVVGAAPREGIVHVQYQPAAFDLLGDVCLMPLALRVARPRVTVVTTLHDARVPYLFPGAGTLRAQAVRLLARTSHAVIAADKRDLQALGIPRGHVVPIGSNIPCAPPAGYAREAFRARLGVGPDELAVVYFGLLNASKGLDTLLDAFEGIEKVRKARLLLVGGRVGASDPTDRLTASRLAERLGDRALHSGFVEPPEVSQYLLAADVAVLPYRDGASPRRGALLACAEHGLPIVSTQPASDAVADAVLAVAPDDAQALTEAVTRVAEDAGLAERLREGSRALAQRVSWAGIAERHEAIYAQAR
jgi:glycosyltransferase involved in cell wall biosynthesis